MQKHASYKPEVLHLIRASAGSGKTHRLTGEYIRLLFLNPNNHKHILAVTFTNKATEEMKSRIVQELFKLASGEASGYLGELMHEFSMSELETRKMARNILEGILHDYSAFSVSTIDRFFQRTMRAFTREIGLSGGYNVEVEESAMLMEAVDLMLSELNSPEQSDLSRWLLQFMKESIKGGKDWKIEREVYDLSQQLSNETYKSLSAEEFASIADKQFLDGYRKMLLRITLTYEQELKKTAERALNIMAQHELTAEDFKYGRNSGFLLFSKLANGEIAEPSNRLRAAANNVEAWIRYKSKGSAYHDAYNAGLNDCLNQIILLLDNDMEYATAKAILQNFYTLGILSDIKRRLQELQQEKNTLFLSDTTEILNHIIAGTDAPFIFEKTGTMIRHYMIDEFQDTSRMQWENFRPLISESLASGHFNLIVGDIKQSIYRWRNSDWQLLEHAVEEQLHSEYIQNHILNTNWRSDAHIVRFNNSFFSNAASILQNRVNSLMEEVAGYLPKGKANSQITDAYAEVCQELPSKKESSGGRVKLQFFSDDDEKQWREQALEQLPKEIEALQDQGFALKEIAILVRKNKEATEVAEYLLSYAAERGKGPYRYDIISDEALLIGKAQGVKAIIALMRYFQHPNDPSRCMMALYEYYRFRHHATPEEAIRRSTELPHGEVPPEVRDTFNQLKGLPFYEMIESFFARSVDAIEEQENAHIQAFLDIALQFSSSRASDLNNFLEWWDEKGVRKAIFSPDSQDAIRLMTIHKAKGLGFGAVIMPFVSWNTDHGSGNGKTLWCKPSVAPFKELQIVPLKYGKSLTKTIFREDYLKERRLTYIDNLNLLYVAFTRAKHQLIAFAPTPKKQDKIADVADLLWEGISMDSPTSSKDRIDLPSYFSEDEQMLVYGETAQRIEKEATQANYAHLGKWNARPFDNRLQLRLNGIGYFTDDGSRDYGKMMHAIVSNVETLNDIPNAVDRIISEGELPEQERDNIIDMLRERLSLPGVANWYDGSYRVLNETQLLHPKWGFRRPDRVMMGADEVIVADYKFGEAENGKYVRQVKHYVGIIREMGYKQVSGFIFYIKKGNLVQVS